MSDKRSCKTCRFLEVPPDSAGRRRVYRDAAYICYAPIPELPKLPDSVTQSPWFKPVELTMKRRMCGNDGVNCPAWEALT